MVRMNRRTGTSQCHLSTLVQLWVTTAFPPPLLVPFFAPVSVLSFENNIITTIIVIIASIISKFRVHWICLCGKGGRRDGVACGGGGHEFRLEGKREGALADEVGQRNQRNQCPGMPHPPVIFLLLVSSSSPTSEIAPSKFRVCVGFSRHDNNRNNNDDCNKWN